MKVQDGTVKNSEDNPSDYISDSILPYIKWKHVKPCKRYLDEKAEWNNALSCASDVFTKEEMKKLREEELPECYVVDENAPGIFKSEAFNYIPIYSSVEDLFGAVLGLYTSEDRRIFLVENYDIESSYRHEIQHHIFRVLDREKEDSGLTAHSHVIWRICEESTYSPSKGAIEYYKNRDMTKADIVMKNFLIYSSDQARKILIFPYLKNE